MVRTTDLLSKSSKMICKVIARIAKVRGRDKYPINYDRGRIWRIL